ncbi:F-box/LRR-repeat protein 2-like [Aphidius gifuensis]|uniref:F-box/LRR-repeat protein 2-like n=1 Tax=Aphidius gifuensis TaxID=684658 RepID=UPI001CDCAEFD|nr:F-box/LRR-repeat protein 2-like [Aphidius gifuensis]
MSAKIIGVEQDQQFSDDDKDQKVDINSLDYDSLAEIFMLLSIPERIDMEKVCVKWKGACQRAWYDTKKYKCESSIERSYNNQHINLSLYMDFSESYETTTDKVLYTIFSTCKNLKHLDIARGPYDVAKIPLKKWINLQNLQYLAIPCIITPDLASTIVQYCKNLKGLRIHSLHQIMNDAALKKLTELENLECLSLLGCVILKEESIIAISNNCKKLKRLDIPSGSIYDDPPSSPSVFDEISKLQYLEHLNLYSVRSLKKSTIIAIANNCKNLKSLEIADCKAITEKALVALTKLENLQKLDVSFLDITDSFISKLKGLKELDCAHCKKLTEAGIIQFIKNNPDLEEISVDEILGCNEVPFAVLDELSKLQYLEHLNLCGLLNLRSGTITAIANNCKYLKSLRIRGCSPITETALVALTELENLEKLDVSFLDITDSFISKLKGLKAFQCTHCKKLTNDGIIQLIKNNPDLKRIDVRCIDNITYNDLVNAANQAVKNRTNGVILHIKISIPLTIQASETIIKSQWLVVE